MTPMLHHSGVTRCITFIVLYKGRMSQCGLLAVLWSHIGILIRFLAVTQDHYSPLSVHVDDPADPVFDGVGLAGFNSSSVVVFFA